MSLHPRASSDVFVPDESNTRLLRDAFGRFATGVTIVTAAAENGVAAITANSFSSVSLSPPLVLWSPDKKSRRFSYFEAATHYSVHVLSADQDDLCWAVAKDVYALNDRGLHLNAEGVPVLENCLARFECTKTAVYEGGDHVIMLGQVNRAQMREEGDPLAFFKGQMGRFTTR
ncbi:flavin reductase family protein [Litoreibacter janthinus]|uniref:NADH-FMN oxidoreductase RutF, flavin reductase (DIM6/NTAB) family n=1 Tax=Litoreibacter janthinus TaxID=670154 RepID=A0A1I6GCI4_9RHOB|nr:flavin reductase family protein [Litoreibacter janthinus]SFR39899.1 NADH-FMN oxidoreductase RutF, flavin reductase (DIM6/NTAB) family [Litoreibacter janthinus]